MGVSPNPLYLSYAAPYMTPHVSVFAPVNITPTISVVIAAQARNIPIVTSTISVSQTVTIT